MHIKTMVRKNTYADSMSLMGLSAKVNELPYVVQAVIGMGTDLNKTVIADVGLLTDEVTSATARDQILVVQCRTEEECDLALAEVDAIRERMQTSRRRDTFSNAAQAFDSDPDSTLVVISVPGEYAAAEARRALEAGKNVMIFSDNVSVEDELDLKRYAHDHGLLVMGPDCGTAIINNTGLCFANAVRPGPIGVVAASGTGSQEVSVRVDALGSGISQLIGVGGRDLSEEIGGIMMLDGLAMLDADPETAVVVLISKPPADAVAATVLDAANRASKPVVVCFIGAEDSGAGDRVHVVGDTRAAALAAVRLATGDATLDDAPVYDFDLPAIRAGWRPGQRSIRGLFCGGTVCDEVFHVVRGEHADTYSNIAKAEASRLAPSEASRGHSLLDLGSDEFTQGRPHPMIDPAIRNARILVEAEDPETAVILLDFELGTGSHPTPVSAASSAIREARAIAARSGRPLEIVGYVLGTDRDPQDKKAETELLHELGVRVVSSAVDLGTQALEMIRTNPGEPA